MSTVDFGITRDGYTQLRRRWVADHPKAVVLLVHGLDEHCGRYEHIGDALATAGYHTVAFDLRGHGMSGGVRTHVEDFSAFLDDLEDHLVQVRGVGLPVVLLGHSMGGLISARYLVADRPPPDLAVLSAPALNPGFRPPPAAAVGLISATVPTLHLPAVFGTEVLSRDDEVQRAYSEDPLVERGMTVRLAAQMLEAMTRVNADRDRLTVPTLIIHGGDDRLVPAVASEPFDALESVDRTVYEGLRHEVLNEPEWETVLGDVITWMDRHL